MHPPLRSSLGPRGATLIEVLSVLGVVSVLLGSAIPGFVSYRDRAAVTGAAATAAEALHAARAHAVRRGERTALRVDTAGRRLVIVTRRDTIREFPLGEIFGVWVATTRDSLAWSPSGLGFGAANTRLEFGRGAARDTISVSRLGRVRR